MSVDQPAQRRAAPINERVRDIGVTAFFRSGSGRVRRNALTAAMASNSCEPLLVPPVTTASQMKRPLCERWKRLQSKKALVSSDCWRIRSKIQATSAKPVAREPDPAAADQARLPSPWRARVSLHGSSATGIHSGHSKPSATFSSAARLRATNAANLLMSFPDDSSPSGLPERPAHPKFPFATDPMSAQQIVVSCMCRLPGLGISAAGTE